MRWLALLLLFVGCGGKKSLGEECSFSSDCNTKHCAMGRCTNGTAGEVCSKDYHCDDTCWRGLCRKAVDGVDCDSSSDCDGLKCIENKCVSKQREAAASAAREAKILAQSGVSENPGVEKQINPAAAGARIRVATATAKDNVFAACRSDERLVGGSCKLGNQKWSPFSSYPSGQSETDTVGARWNCDGSLELTAYALCAKITAP